MRQLSGVLCFLMALAGAALAPAEPLKSGLQVGEKVAGLKVLNCTSTAAGQKL